MTMAADKQDKVLNCSSEREQSGACSSSAEREKNQGKNFLNVPNKREQSQTCLNSAERAGLRPKGNVPNKREQSQTCINSAERAGLRPKGNVPTLRFPEFSGEYEITRIGKLTNKVGSGVTPKGGESVYTSEGHPFVRSQNVGNGQMFLDDIAYIDEDTHNKQIATEIKHGDVLLNITGASIGRCCVASDFVVGGNVNQHVCIVRPTQDVTSYYLCSLLLSDKGQKQIDSFQAGGNRQGLNFEQIKSFKFSIPKLSEQMKVSELLTLVDERITTQIRIIEDLKSERKFLLEQLFCLPKEHTPKLRLKGMIGDWYKVRLYDIVERITERNKANTCSRVLTIAAQYGLIDQQEFFNKQIASSDLTTYYLLHKGDFAYNKSYSGDYPWGAVKRLDNYNKGVLSSLYVCFRPNGNVDSDFLCHYFESTKWYRGISEISGEGARNHGLLNMSVDDYFNTIHRIPSLEEQRQISTMLNTIVQKIKIEESIIDKLQKQKSYLLKEMFV